MVDEKDWEPRNEEEKYSIPVRNILKIAMGTILSSAHKFYFDMVDGKIVNVLEDGSKACAAVISRILICVMYKNYVFLEGPHATVDSLVADLELCGWANIDLCARRPGSVVVWEEVDGNRHVGIGVSEYKVLSNCKEKKVPVLHDWTTESDDETPRAIERILWHPLFADT
ncbi:MAG TPA: hypothetical protein VJB56_00920 [Candidatus Paceibacterota bacterium]